MIESTEKIKKIENLPEPIEIKGFPILLDVYNGILSENELMKSLRKNELTDEFTDKLKKSG